MFGMLCGLARGPLQAAEVYKSVDAQGHVVYSDHPDLSVPQTRVDLQEPNVYSDDGATTAQAPPPLQDGEQPPCPQDGYLWTPGYWAWNAGGYFWVPGEWVLPPRVGVLWTPGYWEYLDKVYVFHRGYWATYVGYYGGINYGYGYFGSGFTGGRWSGNVFSYDHAEYARATHRQVSYHGGAGGTSLAPTAQERALALEPHLGPTLPQRHSLTHAAGMPRPRPTPPQTVRTHMPTSTPERQRVTATPAPLRQAPAPHPRTTPSRAAPVRLSRTPRP